MFSRPIAFVLVAVACVVAAGGGAYIATLQHARSDSAIAAGQQPQSPLQPAAQVSANAPAPDLVSNPPSTQAAAPRPQPAPDDAATSPAHKASTPVAASQAARATRQQPRPAPASVPAPPDRSSDQAATAETGAPSQKPATPLPAPQAPVPVPAPPDSPSVAQAPGNPASEPAAEPQKVWEEVSLPADSVIGLQLESPLSSETARVEDRVDARVTRDVRVDGRMAIPAGSHAIGSVVVVERGGKIKDRARLGIRFNTLVLADTSRVPITTETVYREGEAPSTQSSAKIGGAAIGGAIIGAILGGGKGAAIGSGIGAAGGTAAAMAGDRRPVVLPAGTPLTVRTQAPVTVTIEK